MKKIIDARYEEVDETMTREYNESIWKLTVNGIKVTAFGALECEDDGGIYCYAVGDEDEIVYHVFFAEPTEEEVEAACGYNDAIDWDSPIAIELDERYLFAEAEDNE